PERNLGSRHLDGHRSMDARPVKIHFVRTSKSKTFLPHPAAATEMDIAVAVPIMGVAFAPTKAIDDRLELTWQGGG
ncbi:hypothetical protein ACWDRB_67635, partial [Nonomuraea sp. NPDC003707]